MASESRMGGLVGVISASMKGACFFCILICILTRAKGKLSTARFLRK